MKDLEGRTAVVMGGGMGPDGIGNGAAISIAYARAGAMVVVVDRDRDAAERTVAEILEEGGAALSMTADVLERDQLAATADRVRATFGRLDVLHNNVGVVRTGSIPELPESDWRLVLDTNLTSVFLTCTAFLDLLVAHRGAIVNTSSLAGSRYTGYRYAAYYAAKAGLEHLSRTMAVELAPRGVRVNAIAPGMIDSPLIYRDISGSYASHDEMRRDREQAVPMKAMGSVWDVAEASLFLASDRARYITGVCLPVDGGLSAASG